MHRNERLIIAPTQKNNNIVRATNGRPLKFMIQSGGAVITEPYLDYSRTVTLMHLTTVPLCFLFIFVLWFGIKFFSLIFSHFGFDKKLFLLCR